MDVHAYDLSLTGTGFYDGEHLAVCRTKKRGHERLQIILDEVEERCALTDPVVFIEGFSYGSRGSSVYEIAGLGYLVRHYLYAAGIPFAIVPPTVLKKYATGKGNAGKPDMLDAAIRRFGYQGTTDDNAVDAFLLWHLGMQHLGLPVVPVPKDRALVADTIEWEGEI